ncbi:MAG TPA: PQQ-binding-like beta-propeller repeat protein, partial [Planctomycetota bacterium]|nr:PQQ-binding-like beta-propeller repeat protein [Planctomycetota bacterium]
MPARIVLVLSFAATVVAQEAPAPKAATARAAALLKELDQPDRCLDAARELVALGPAALPVVHSSLVDPRPDVVRRALFVASGLAGDVESLREPILRCLRHKDLGVALAARDAWPALDGGGATLVTDYHAGKALRLLGDERQELLAGLPFVMGVQQLPDGHLLVAAYAQHRVVEFDAKGEESWACAAVRQPSDAERLPDGHTLIADSGNKRVIEVDRAGEVVWIYDQDVRPIDVDRLANGNTLIASYQASGVVVVDRSGAVVWQ